MYNNIPKELRELKQWVAWKREIRDTSIRKVPLDPKHDRNAKVNDCGTWSTFEAACGRTGRDGIGFVLTHDDCFVGIDIDHCIVDGVLSDKAQKFISHYNSYTELSPSRSGVHIFIRAHIKKSFKKREGGKALEIYGDVHFLTMTGDHLPSTPLEIHDRQKKLDALLKVRQTRANRAPHVNHNAAS